MNENDKLAALYPSMQEQPQQQPSAAPPRSEQEIADLFYGDAALQEAGAAPELVKKRTSTSRT